MCSKKATIGSKGACGERIWEQSLLECRKALGPHEAVPPIHQSVETDSGRVTATSSIDTGQYVAELVSMCAYRRRRRCSTSANHAPRGVVPSARIKYAFERHALASTGPMTSERDAPGRPE